MTRPIQITISSSTSTNWGWMIVEKSVRKVSFNVMQTIMKTMKIVAMMMMAMAMVRLRTWPEEGRRMPTLARVRRAGGREINLVMMTMIREATAAVYKTMVMIYDDYDDDYDHRNVGRRGRGQCSLNLVRQKPDTLNY